MTSKTTAAASAAAAGTGIVTAFIVVLLFACTIGAWATMIGLGILHSEFLPAIPALGLWKSFLTSIGISLVFGGRSAGKSS